MPRNQRQPANLGTDRRRRYAVMPAVCVAQLADIPAGHSFARGYGNQSSDSAWWSFGLTLGAPHHLFGLGFRPLLSRR